MNYDNLIKKYEGVAVPHRGIKDDIKYIVITVISNLYKNDFKLNKLLCDSLSIYRYIESINIDENCCSIDFYDDGKIRNIKFGCYYFDDEYKKMCYTTDELIKNGASVEKIKRLSGTYKFKGECHSASLYYLETFKDKNIRAITSICNSCQGLSFFHSYVWDRDNNLVYDLARNIVMDKDDYDYLFTLEEINCFSYRKFNIYNSIFPTEKYHKLLHLALISLSKFDKKINISDKVLKLNL